METHQKQIDVVGDGSQLEVTRNVIIISDVLPAPTYAASLTMFRHMVERDGFRITQVDCKRADATRKSIGSRVFSRLKNSRLHRYIVDLEFAFNRVSQVNKNLPNPASIGSNSLVFTLAHGNGCWIAERYAKCHDLPLVVRFDDWWPDMIQAHSAVRSRVEKAFRRLYQSADVAICISEEMREALGPHANARVIVPIPRLIDGFADPIRYDLPLRICYMGNMYDYGPMLAMLVAELDSEEQLHIEFRGGSPRWPNDLVDRLQSEGRLHPFSDGPEFQDWLESFHVYLVTLFFEPEHQRRVETCFATKLTEYCSLGRAIVIWAPETSAVVKWAKKYDAAICVTDPDPAVLVKELSLLANNFERLAELEKAARKSYLTDFHPSKLQDEFLSAVDSVRNPVL